MLYYVGADFGRQVALPGYDIDLSLVEEGGPIRLTIYWQAQRECDAFRPLKYLLPPHISNQEHPCLR